MHCENLSPLPPPTRIVSTAPPDPGDEPVPASPLEREPELDVVVPLVAPRLATEGEPPLPAQPAATIETLASKSPSGTRVW
jgi:hypothetical protein